MKLLRKLFRTGAIVSALMAFSSYAMAQSVKIGLPVPLTGFVAESARDMVDGFKLYLKQSGNKLGGKIVDLKIEDTEANPQNALTKMRKLVENDKVDLVVGYLLAPEGLAVRDYVDSHKVPLFLPIVAADDLTQRKRSPYIVRMTWTSSQPNHPFGKYAYEKLGYKKIVTVGQDYAFGWENVGGFQTTFEAAGGKIIDKI
jgi:branched-chain amino acid transport system substrate-binding protein